MTDGKLTEKFWTEKYGSVVIFLSPIFLSRLFFVIRSASGGLRTTRHSDRASGNRDLQY
jgi:hypothetical protein